MSFTTNGRNRNDENQLDDKKKNDIENLLNEEFCTLQTETYGLGNTCTIQNLDFRVERRCGSFLDFTFFFRVGGHFPFLLLLFLLRGLLEDWLEKGTEERVFILVFENSPRTLNHPTLAFRLK